ncbi:MAG: ABC transporter permease [Lewinellaceae bacterium]|mgnify:CR=1 FL=1|nr:ABC transporter permease [Saprospiraceae bacterium]MCB9312203.1 ABC transporter permease [Lewinellaceae bacterium]HRW76420.1 ABC transporter permease [Saprospiraceae bacterium]
MKLPLGTRNTLAEIGDISRFTARFFREWGGPRFEVQEFFRQCYMIGNRSLGLVGITGFILGLVMTIQSRPTMAQFGAEDWIPSMVSVSIIREIGPVVIALICAGKIGSGIGAELGSMKVTEQIDAMEVSGTNPFKYLVVTRVWATTFMVPLLVIFADVVAMYGSYLAVNIRGDTSLALFTQQFVDILAFSDVLPAFIKTFFFGFAIGIIGCYKGYTSNKGTEGVGLAANSAVVVASLMVFILDLLAVQITDLLGLT